jgi:hypothetical protein
MAGVTDSQRPPGRAGLGVRDLVGALIVLMLIAGVVAAVTRGCSFDPGGPSVDRDSAPTVDVSVKLHEAASSVSFPVRRPTLPSSWHANSSSTSGIGNGSAANVVVRVGWLTPAGRYVQVSQSGGKVADVLAEETGAESERTGSVTVSGTSWTTYPSRRSEVAWVAELDGAVVIITGNGTEQEFRQAATAVTDAKPIAK